MLKILDRYIIKKYLTTFLFVMFIATIIAIAIDFSDKIDNFIEESVTLEQVIFDYYLNWIPHINALLVPLYVLITVIFFSSRLAADNEIISILNAGVSFRRLLRPYLIAAMLITSFHLVFNHFIIPLGNKSRLDFERKYVFKKNDKALTRNIHMFIAPNEKVFIGRYRKKKKSANNFRMEQFKDNQIVNILKAKSIKWLGEESKRWELSDYEIRSFKGMKESILIGKGEKLDTMINLSPSDFVRYLNEKESMSTPALYDYIDAERAKGIGNTKVFEIEIYRRTAEPITIIIVTLIGVSLAARKIRAGMGLNIMMGFGIGAAYFFLSKFASTFVTNQNLSPLLGVWIPNLIFLIVALVLIFKAQK